MLLARTTEVVRIVVALSYDAREVRRSFEPLLGRAERLAAEVTIHD